MNLYFEVLQKCPLFQDITEENLLTMLDCLQVKTGRYKKGQTIFAEGEPAKFFGILLTGAAKIVRVDYYGNRSIVASLEPAQIFGESFACAKIEALPVDVVAAENTEVLLIDARRILQSCSHACSFHNQMIFNLLKVVATKNLVFHQKLEITSKRSTREKLMTYLLLQAKYHHSNSFIIPYDRQELADYLEVERSGLSAEISKLRREGILECRRSQFTLLSSG